MTLCVINLMKLDLADVLRTKLRWSLPKICKLVQALWRCGQSNIVASFCGQPCRFPGYHLALPAWWPVQSFSL